MGFAEIGDLIIALALVSRISKDLKDFGDGNVHLIIFIWIGRRVALLGGKGFRRGEQKCGL